MGLLVRRWWLWSAAVLVVLTVLVWLLWPSRPQPPRARQYLDLSACLLTDDRGVAGPVAASVWAGMQDASTVTHVRVQYLAVAGEATVGNALPYLASLLQRRCAVVAVVGAAEAAAVEARAVNYPVVRFVVVDGSGMGGNVTTLTGLPAGQLRDRVRDLVIGVAHSNAPR